MRPDSYNPCLIFSINVALCLFAFKNIVLIFSFMVPKKGIVLFNFGFGLITSFCSDFF